MADCVTEKPVAAAPRATSSEDWSVGVIAPCELEVPAACLEHCLDNDPARAPTHGCAMIKTLAERARGNASPAAAEGDVAPPPVCEKAYAVSLCEGDGPGSPDVLILRPPTAGAEAAEAAVEAVRSAAAEAWRLKHENDGLADEVLRGYEQINFIFDVSAHIASLSDGEEVRRMLMTKIKDMFTADAVFLILGDRLNAIQVDRSGQIVRGWLPGHIRLNIDPTPRTRVDSWDLPAVRVLDLPPEFEGARCRLEESPSVFVSTADATGEWTGHGTSMWGALRDDEKSFSIVGIIRRHAPFTSADMLLLDSALTYGGHVLRNLQLVEQLQRTSFEVVRTLVNAIDQKDNYTSGHSERVGFLARATGQAMGLPAKQLKELEWAALLHDVGKIGIPEHVLNKPGKLTEDEYAIIKGHPSRGEEILDPVASLEPVLEGVLYHHENPDGTGYPEGLEGDAIPVLARIIHVVDVFDALTSTRSYRKAYNVERALNILKNDAGTKLDTEIVQQFFGAWARLPVTHPAEYERWFGSRKETEA